jgi:long-chain acyl-CoA synthetase
VVKLRTILLTGANGFIATQIARNLLEDKETEVLALTRASDGKAARAKLTREWWDFPDLVNVLDNRIQAVCGDVCQPNLGMSKTDYVSAASKVTHIIHAAADWRLLPIEELRKTNVQGTANVVAFAREASKKHQFERLSHISTAYVAGGKTGTVLEDELTDEYGFFTDYERSKYEGEKLIQDAKDMLPISIFRPSMVVGDSKSGAIKTFNTFYFPLRLYLTGKMRFMPVSKSLKINMVPVDYVAKSIAKLTFDSKAEGLTFHVVANHDSLPKLGELLDYVRKWAETELACKLPAPICLKMSASQTRSLLRIQRALTGGRRFSDALISLTPYFSENRQFSRSNIDRLLGNYDLDWRQIMPKLLSYAVYNSFFHRSDRTVHEQVMFRLESKSYPVTYYDIANGKITMKTAQEMHQEIAAATNALQASGIAPGDRVTLTGLNASRYLAADVAIGLAGAVSVPIYYSMPPLDINEVLKASGAKLFFVGIPSLLARVDELLADVPIVSICSEPAPQNVHKHVISWEEFLSKGSGNSPARAPVGFSDIATLRYSSGTTGKPKGAVFKHENFRYMAESIVSITSWKARNRTTRYLSFLPMGHVVEGILGTYSPYYAPAPVEIYFLEDFRKLQKALPQVKPTVFFAVPRIYEKTWEALEKNRFGKIYTQTKNPLLKRTLRGTLKHMTLRRAGFDRCAQLIAGSASSGENLLLNFRGLGIEIYDAYGMTEAPLVTLNRLGRNRIGTVGEPMPKTELRIAEDGEVMVKGPQVTAGYFDKSLDLPFKNGWLMTGDIGKLTEKGSLVIFGRKKELIKTSYGKCIYSGKIEGMIMEIDGVSEALLIGESKPFCTALVWVDQKKWNKTTFVVIDKAIEEMNARLSNPEKLKRWALLVNNLSIENGDLTPNLKLKRNVVAQKFASVIGALYGEVAPEGEVHIGGIENAGE